MDNSNNNSSNNPWPAQPAGGPPPQNPPDLNIPPVIPPAVPQIPQDANFSWPPVAQPNPTFSTPPPPLPEQIPTVPINPLSYPQPSPQPEPVVNQPILDTNFSWPPVAQPNPTFSTPPPPLPEQIPTALPISNTAYVGSDIGQQSPYTDPNAAAAATVSTQSSLDNPYGSPMQPPPIDGGLQNPQIPPSTEPAWSPSQAPTEQAPTDLSHLISSNESNNQTIAQPEIVVMPQTNAPDVPVVQAENKGGIPKWIVGLGVGLLIIVAGASAYFILGIGKQPTNTSLPATEAPKVNQQESTPAPSANPPAATGSANFGELQGNQAPPQASSAADIIRARQQQGQ